MCKLIRTVVLKIEEWKFGEAVESVGLVMKDHLVILSLEHINLFRWISLMMSLIWLWKLQRKNLMLIGLLP